MNKNLFRIIFNKRRGQLMAVAETSSSQGKGSLGETSALGEPVIVGHTTVAISALSFAVLCALGAVLWALPTPNAKAQVVAYRNAPSNQQPTVLQTANGVPQVNIQTPSAAGVSRNVYSQFDVQSNGAILNNSRTSVQTQQGGWIQGNPWLATGSARVILNEVNSSNPSYLNGYVEVAGQRAEVVIANPSGISVNGGGFINTSKATLTTGTPIVNGGSLDGYRVHGGNISINGNGLDISTTDYSAILARAVQVNAGIWANELKVVTGANQIDAASLAANTTPVATTIAGTGSVPSYALDVAQIGGMYAGKIHLIGTEQGLGVRSAGIIGSNGGDLVLQNNGWLTTTGTIQATANLQITTQGNITNSGALYASNDQTLGSTGSVNNSGVIAAQGNTSITANSLSSTSASVVGAGIKTDGTLFSSGNLNIATTQALAANGQNLAAGDITVTGSSVDFSGSQTSAKNVGITTDGNLNTTNATVVASQALTVSSADLDNARGTLAAGQAANLQTNALNNDAGLIQVGGDLIINTHGQTLTNSNAANYTSIDAALNGKGGIEAQGTTILTTGSLNNDAGYIGSKGAVTADSDDISNIGGLIRSVATTSLSAATITNDNSSVINQGIEGFDVSLSANTLRNKNGAIRAGHNLTVNSMGTVDNTAGLMSTGNAFTLQDAQAQASRTLAITNAAGTLIAGQNLDIRTSSLEGNGKVLSNNDLNLSLNANISNSGQVIANHNAILSTTADFVNSGKLQAGNLINLTANNVDNTVAGEISANTNQINASNTLTNRGLLDGVDTQITAGIVYNIGTGRIYGDHVSIGAANLINHAETVNGIAKAATIAARARLDIGVSSLINTGNALIYSAGDMDVGGALGINRYATSAAQSIVNSGSTIEAANTLKFSAQTVQNLNRDLTYRVDTIPNATSETTYVTENGRIIAADQTFVLYRAGKYWVQYHPDHRSSGYWWTNSTALYVLKPESIYNTPTYQAAYNAADVVSYQYGVPQSVTPSVADLARWQFYGLTRPATTAPVGTRPEPICSGQDSEGGCIGYDTSAQQAWDAAAAPYIDLQNKINSLRLAVQADQVRVNSWADYQVDQQVLTVTNSNPGQIKSGAGMSLNASTNLLNDMSQIIAGGALTITGQANLENRQRSQTTTDTRHGIQYLWSYKDWGCGGWDGCDWERTAYWDGAYRATIDKISTLSLAQSLQNQTVSNSYNVTNKTNIGPLPTIANVGLVSANKHAAVINTTLPTGSLYQTNPSAAAQYLVETDPRFTNQKNWLGSDYMGNALSLDSNVTQKRLGDGFYEQKLIREQVAELTGRRFLGDYTSDEQQYQALMDSGITYAKQYNLRPGIALSDAQLAQLTSDIVWLVEQTITLPDGRSQKALVPQLYVKALPGDLDASGALLSGKDVNIYLGGDLTNSGTIAGRRVVSLETSNLSNLGGLIQGESMTLSALQDINNIGGSMSATNSLSATAGRDLNVNSVMQQGGSADSSVSLQRVERVAGLYVSGANGQLSVDTGRDINLTAAKIINAGTGATILKAGNAVSLQTLTESERFDVVMEADKQYSKASQSQEIGSSISGGGNVTISGKDINARAATLEAGNTLSLNASNNVKIEAGVATQDFSGAIKSASHGGVLGSDSETVTKQTYNSSAAQASNLGGKQVQIQADNDIGIKGSNVVSDNGTTLVAKNDVNIESASNSQAQGYGQKTVEKGFLGGGSGLSISYGERKQSLDNQSTSTTAAASTVGSVGGNVSITASNQYKQIGSDVLAPQGDINITAKTVDIQEARETNKQSTEQKFEQSGLTLAVTSTVLSTLENAQSQIKATTQTSDGRMKALGTASAAANVKMAADALKAGQGDENGMVKTGAKNDDGSLKTNADGTPETAQANAADKAGGIQVSLSYGQSSSQSNSTATSDTARGSNVKAGGTTTIKATGAGADSNLTVQGSDVSGKVVNLEADNKVNLTAAQNTSTQTSTNSNSSASVGIALQLGNSGAGLGFTGSVSKGGGNSNGSETTYTNTHIAGADSVSIKSGSDTNVKGATVEGKQVTATVGGNLNIESLQDTATYAEQNKQIGASGMIGAGMSGSVNYAKSNINSSYASVTEQSGLKAGDGGFTVNVQGNTDLKGGAITSTQAAIDNNKNKFQTGGSLTSSDIENKASYEAKSVSVSVGAGGSPMPGQGLSAALSGAGMGKDSGSTTSTTTAGISGIAGDTAKRTGDNAQGIGKIFDADKVRQEIQAQTKITQEFAKQASTTIASYSDQQKKDLQAQIRDEKTGKEDRAVLKQQLDQVILEEKVLNILVGAVTGFGQTMVTKESLATAAEQMRQAVNEDSAKFKGVVDKNGNLLFSNQSGDSAGVDGDGKKDAGTRVDLDRLCGADNSRCAKNSDGSLALTENGEVTFMGVKKTDGTLQAYAEFLQTEDGKKMLDAPFGGQQGSGRTWLFGEYPKGGTVDKLLEVFAGPHDTIGGKWSGLYDDQGNTTRGRSDEVKAAHEVWSGVALVPAAPFAAAKGFPPEVWKAIGIFLKAGQ